MTPDMNFFIKHAQKLKEVERLAQNGKRIEAIKLYLKITNVGLKEAKDAVESLERGEPFVRLDNVSTTATPQAEKMKEVVRLIKEGNKIGAIKVFREATGVGLKEAKEAVEAIERNRSATINTVTTSTPYTTTPATPSTPPIMETVSPLNGVVVLILLLVLLISGAAALAWFVSPELREMIVNILK
ncbi:MAG: ribosomal protein L7/L12 [Chloroflexota bacterium]